MSDTHEYIQNAMLTYYINQFSWPTSHNFLVMKKNPYKGYFISD